ncbi:MAG TPA: hypothetical protein VGS22_01560 [Thermoanaerobaculia bacterium]|jgi:hypothetical protein|nr:hypothetical protein [Thermoanaerobaculia bacterium]
MRTSSKIWIGVLWGGLMFGLPWVLLVPGDKGSAGPPVSDAGANVSALSSSFRTWSAAHAASGGDKNVFFALGWAKGFSREKTSAGGTVRLDLVDGTARVDLSGLPVGTEWDVWLVENSPDGGAMPDAGDRMQRLGRVTSMREGTTLSARLGGGFFQYFRPDQVVVVRAGEKPEQGGVLFGSPDLFQRLYMQRGTRLPAPPKLAFAGLASPFGPGVANATPFDSLDPLVAEGAVLFQEETFGGNGRTCASCHPARNNFTIDPKFIATLPANDPLFVFETNPDLAQNFEKGNSLRQLGLVLENPDGFDDLGRKFVLRGVPHTLALMHSRKPQPGSPFEPIPPVERLGWGGDGAPASGSLRDFALGAITQHFTRNLARRPGIDFRVPTDHELDAMAAFQLALGRQEDLDLASLRFTSPIVTRGQEIYLTGDTVRATKAAGKCNRCHFNGGSNVSVNDENRNFDVGIEDLPDHPANLIQPGGMPVDRGFGRGSNPRGGFGTGRFNSAVVVEAADTGPFFHNNAVATIEEAVDFYNSTAFNQSPAGLGLKGGDTGNIGIHLETTQVEAVAALLRVLNSLENIRSSSELDQAALGKDLGPAANLLDIASFDTEDAYQVLEERSLHLDAAKLLRSAYQKERQALGQPKRNRRDPLIRDAIAAKGRAKALMLVSQ